MIINIEKEKRILMISFVGRMLIFEGVTIKFIHFWEKNLKFTIRNRTVKKFMTIH
jgi:hypothetical protein